MQWRGWPTAEPLHRLDLLPGALESTVARVGRCVWVGGVGWPNAEAARPPVGMSVKRAAPAVALRGRSWAPYRAMRRTRFSTTARSDRRHVWSTTRTSTIRDRASQQRSSWVSLGGSVDVPVMSCSKVARSMTETVPRNPPTQRGLLTPPLPVSRSPRHLGRRRHHRRNRARSSPGRVTPAPTVALRSRSVTWRP